MKFTTSEGVLDCTPQRLIVAGWTGRNKAAVDHHIAELEAIGVPAPSTVPLFYQCAPELLTQASQIQVVGKDTSGEAEPFLIKMNGIIWLGLASDHTDRALETYSVAHSKQIAAKPVAGELWPFDSVQDHLDEIVLQSWILEEGAWTLYQDGTLAAIRPLKDLMDGANFQDGTAMLCGTLPAIGGVRPAADFKMRMYDPKTSREITWAYSTLTLDAVA